MDLRSGCTYWPQADAALGGENPPLGGTVDCDVAVIGGGVSGALAAFHLIDAGIDTVLVDRREVGRGSTAASTGLLQYEIDTPLVDLIARIGEPDATRAYRLCFDCLGRFRALVDRLGDPCGLAARPSLYLATDPADAAELRREAAARQACGIDVEYLDAAAIRQRFPFSRPAALWSRSALQVDPYRLTLVLLDRAARRGLRIFAGTEVIEYDPGRSGADPVALRTTGAGMIRARRVVFATGYETPEFLDQSICTLKSTYALAGEAQGDLSGWHDRCLIWETARPYFYARTVEGGTVMVGGADEPFADADARDRLIPLKARTLACKFHTLFPGAAVTPTCSWAGTFAETKDGLPYIGTVSQFPKGYFALGYGGNGITFSLIAAEIIRDLVLGRGNEDARLFRFGR